MQFSSKCQIKLYSLFLPNNIQYWNFSSIIHWQQHHIKQQHINIVLSEIQFGVTSNRLLNLSTSIVNSADHDKTTPEHECAGLSWCELPEKKIIPANRANGKQTKTTFPHLIPTYRVKHFSNFQVHFELNICRRQISILNKVSDVHFF